MEFTNLDQILKDAVKAGIVAGTNRLNEIKGKPAYSIHNGDLFTGKPIGSSIGTMHDLCGFAYCYIPVRVLSRRSKAVKALIANRTLSYDEYRKALHVRIPYIDQGISVNESAANAVETYLRAQGIECYTESRLD